MLAAAIGFAVMGACSHGLGPRCDWMVVAWVRVTFMFGAMVLLARGSGVRLVAWKPRTLWLRSGAGCVSLLGNFYALPRLPVADAVTLSNSYPLWVVVIGIVALRAWPTGPELIGVASGLVGVILIQRPHLAGDGSATWAALLASLATAVSMLGLHRLRGVDARAVVAHFAGVASLAVGAGLVFFRPWAFARTDLGPTTLALLLGVCLAGAASQVFLTRAFASGPPATVSVVGLVQVIFALGFDAAIWGRNFSASTLVGFVLVLVPAAWLTIRAGSRQAPRAPIVVAPQSKRVASEVTD